MIALLLLATWPAPPQETEMAGYLLVPHERVEERYNAGFSMYVAAWPLLKRYPGERFQSGLFGTWMFAQFKGEAPKNHYSDIEGGLGWWRDTRFATETPKFIMGGVTLNFSEWANGPGAGKGRNWNNPTGLYGVAQLSPWVLWPPDGLNVKQGTRGDLFGYGYLPLPLTEAKKRTANTDVPTGNQAWTLFLSTANFKGPVAFFTPYFWSKASVTDSSRAGLFLDTLPSDPNRAVQMETQHIPAWIGKSSDGTSYARVAPTQFPDSPLIHRLTVYERGALWDGVQRWFDGGSPISGRVNASASATSAFKADGNATWEIYVPGEDRKLAKPVNWKNYAKAAAPKPLTYTYGWDSGIVSNASENLRTLPEYYKLSNKEWVAVPASAVPRETGLAEVVFSRNRNPNPPPYVTPEDPGSAWAKPGPVAGPFKAKLGDGSVVTYAWYRFADQPALQNADLTLGEREALQKRVEKLHRNWRSHLNYLDPPTDGRLAALDPALLVKPPKGFEVGFVPIVTRQGLP